MMDLQGTSKDAPHIVTHGKPVIVVSRCLGFAPCRWNGDCLHDDTVQALMSHVEFRTPCPEFDIGLGAPREPVRQVRHKGSDDNRLLQRNTLKDLTDPMRQFATDFLAQQGDVGGFILKSKSPSCGLRGVKVFKDMEPGSSIGLGAGIFGQEVLRKYPGIPVEDEGRLSNFIIREQFLTRVFTSHRFANTVSDGSMKNLTLFHAENKFLLMAYSQDALHRLGRIAANADNLPPAAAIERYRDVLNAALSHTMRFTAVINVLLHIFGFFSSELHSEEKAFFLDQLDRYRKGNIPLSALQGILMAWAVRARNDYLLRQSFFQPYPQELMSITDSGKGRDI